MKNIEKIAKEILSNRQKIEDQLSAAIRDFSCELLLGSLSNVLDYQQRNVAKEGYSEIRKHIETARNLAKSYKL